MSRWRCKNDRCRQIVDNGNFSGRIEDSFREIAAESSSPCPVCDQKAGFDNLDYQGIILPDGVSG
jgi:hypothetical protein